MPESFMLGWDMAKTKNETKRIRKLQEQQLKLTQQTNNAQTAAAIQQARLANEQRKGMKEERKAQYKTLKREQRRQEEQEMVSKLSEREQEEYYREKLQARKDLPKKIIIGIICYFLFGMLILPLLLSLLKP